LTQTSADVEREGAAFISYNGNEPKRYWLKGYSGRWWSSVLVIQLRGLMFKDCRVVGRKQRLAHLFIYSYYSANKQQQCKKNTMQRSKQLSVEIIINENTMPKELISVNKIVTVSHRIAF